MNTTTPAAPLFDAEDEHRMSEYAKRAVNCPYCGKRKRGWRANEADVLCAECDRNGVSGL